MDDSVNHSDLDEIDLDEIIAGLESYLKTRRQRQPAVPGGRRLSPTEYLLITLTNLKQLQKGQRR